MGLDWIVWIFDNEEDFKNLSHSNNYSGKDDSQWLYKNNVGHVFRGKIVAHILQDNLCYGNEYTHSNDRKHTYSYLNAENNDILICLVKALTLVKLDTQYCSEPELYGFESKENLLMNIDKSISYLESVILYDGDKVLKIVCSY